MDEDRKYIRLVQTSVTIFIHCGDDYLFLKRGKHKRVDPGRLNGIGGRLELGEDFLMAAIRETREETGYEILAKNVTLAAVVKLEGGYKEDWVVCFFKVDVSDKNVPKGLKNDDGELIWLNKDKVLDSGHDLVDDLNYLFKDIVEGKSIVFLTATLNSREKITNTSIGKLLN